MRAGEREKQSGDKGNSNNQWVVVRGKKPIGHWRHGPIPARNQPWVMKQGSKPETKEKQRRHTWNEGNTFSVFADNPPQDATLQWLWKVFGSTGRVLDVYLSRKVRPKNPLKFAFIRYGTKEEAQKTIEQLDGWLVWGNKIRLTESRYRRDSSSDMRNNGVQSDGRRMVGRQENGNTTEVATKKDKTYKEILLNAKENEAARNVEGGFGLQTLGDSKIYLEEDSMKTDLINRSLVGETLEPYNFDELKEAVIGDWSSMIGVRMFGPMKILMIFHSAKDADEALNSGVLNRHFLEVRKCSVGETNRNRKCWIMVTGLPLQGWTRDNMEKIAMVWGRVVQIEEEAGEHFNFFRAQVVANIGPAICVIANIQVAVAEKTVAGAVEAEESRAGETQPSPILEANDGNVGTDNTGPILEEEENGIGPSPTRTKSLHDDRRTEKVIQEWDDTLFQKPNASQTSPNNVSNSPVVDTDPILYSTQESDELSAPPGFEKPMNAEIETAVTERERVNKHTITERRRGKRSRKTVLKLN
ncbi:hypothetical protein PIB30_026567 [Stylosanthes scabra]|uniref:RRM domain-containing protein n=1 Tax=Stylosanthes scabra TaxID=79078 RepID=A0ABU6SAE0_9FABA|nr:hypothetical protein [Stylosanthes scabra]